MQEEAQALLSFSIHTPSGLGDPTSIEVSDLGTPLDGRVVAFLYDSPTYGRVNVIERLPDVPADQYDKLNALQVDQINANGGTAELDTIRNGATALVIDTADGRAAAYWLEGRVEYYVTGPALSHGDLMKVVEGV